jgi:hypothetical protein
MAVSTILAHVAARTGAALWRNRMGWLGGAVVAAGLGVYQLGFAGPTTTDGAAAGSDCAETTMQAVAKVDDQTAHAAYQCLGQSMRRSGEDAFVETLHQRGELPRGHLNRIGDQSTPDGGRIVFYTLEAQGTAVGYIVYLNAEGKVERIE